MFLGKRPAAATIAFALSILAGSLAAQSTASQPQATAQATTGRLPKTIDGYNTAQVPGTVNPRAQSQYDTGRVNSGTRLDGVTMYFAPTIAQQTDLNLLVREQQTPGSAYYHKWLTPAQFAARFGLSTADIASVKTWLEGQGFEVERVANSRTSITFSGSVSQVESAFQTELHNYTRNGVSHMANATPVSVPQSLSGVVRSIRGLDNFRPQPQVRFHNGLLTPNFTSSQSGDHYMTPGDVATVYDINAAYSAGYTGSGQSIAIVGQSEVTLTDIEAFQTAAGLTVKDPTVVLVPNTGDAAISTGDEAESDLDLEYSSSIAKGANIYFVYVGSSQNSSVFDSMQYAIDTDIAPVISMSYGECEPDLGQADYTTLDAILEQGAAQGQSIIVSTGDTGSTACYADVSTTAKTVTADEEALAVAYPASSAYVTAMGGTEFPAADVASTNSTYWESASGSDVVSSALSYIPEQVWNDDSATYGTEGAYYALSAGGGGISEFVTRPSWQAGVTGIPTGDYRLVPDISLNSSDENAPYLFCTSDTTAWSSGQKASCNDGFRDSSSQDLTTAGGTSFAAPIFAGMLAIINQKTNATGQGVINTTLYGLAADPATYTSAFHDILATGTNVTTTGNQCTAGTTYCSTAGAADYLATTGYDEASGLGSVDLYSLMNAWPATAAGTSTLEATTTSLTAASATPASGAADIITITVAPAAATGTLTVKVDGTTETSTLELASGTATYSFSSTTAGEHAIVATYSGDGTYAPSTGTVTVNVPGSSTTGTGTSTPGTSTVTITSVNSYAGTVDFTLSTSSTSLNDNGCYAIDDQAVTANATATTTLTIYTDASDCSSTTVAKTGSNLRRAFVKKATKSAQRAAPGTPWQSALRISSAFGIAGICFLGFGRRRRKLWSLVALIVVAGVLGLASGCGSGGKTTTTASPSFTLSATSASATTTSSSTSVAAGTYSLTLDGTDSVSSALTASTTLTLTVTN